MIRGCKTLLLVLCTGYVWAQDPGGYKDFHEGILPSKKDSVLEKIRQFPDGTELSIAVIHERRPTFYGLKKEKDTIRAVPNFQSAFEIGSITKVFTATLLANFVEDGMVGQNEPINGYFGFVMGDSIPITFKQLASHTSGLPPLPDNFLKWQKDFRDPYRKYGEEALKEYFIDAINLDEEDQNKYVYSNLGAGVLGFVLATIGNQDLESLFQKWIFSPLQMKNTTLDRDKIAGHMVHGNGAPNWNFDALAGAGGLVSTTEDLSKFALAQFNSENDVLALTRQKTFSISENKGIGLGWHISEMANGKLVWHGGGTGGYRSFMALNVARGDGIIVLSNVSALSNTSKLIEGIALSLFP